MQFSLQLLPPLWEDFTFPNVLNSTFSTSTLTVLTELSPQALETPRTLRVSTLLCFSVAMSSFVF